MDVPLWVECYSGHCYAQEPRAFTWRGERHVVAVVERVWRTPAGPHFRVQTQDGTRFELAYDERTDRWLLNSISTVQSIVQHLDKGVNDDA